VSHIDSGACWRACIVFVTTHLLYRRGATFQWHLRCIIFTMQVSKLTWVERKVASTLFAKPPTATVDDALKYFQEVSSQLRRYCQVHCRRKFFFIASFFICRLFSCRMQRSLHASLNNSSTCPFQLIELPLVIILAVMQPDSSFVVFSLYLWRLTVCTAECSRRTCSISA
jgi:hypothetical protein